MEFNQINVNGVSITLTQDQLEKITRELKIKKYNYFTDIKSLEDAIDFIKPDIYPNKTISYIQIMAKAINLLDNSKLTYNYYPIFTKNSYGPVSFRYSVYDDSSTDGQVAYLKSEEASDHLGKIALQLYRDLYNETKVI